MSFHTKYVCKYTRNEETYTQRRARLGIKRAIILCHESIVKEMQELARKRTQEIIGEDVHVSKTPNPEFIENNHPTNGSVQEEK
jgi:hypothetical protein